MKRYIAFSLSIILIASCSPPEIEVTRTYNDQENFNITTNLEVEFIKDSIEFVKFYGQAASDPISLFSIAETSFTWNSSLLTFLEITGNGMPPDIILEKVEVHYLSIRRLFTYEASPPTNLGFVNYQPIYTHEPIQTDSLDLYFEQRQDSIIKVDVNYLTLDGDQMNHSKIEGNAQYFNVIFNVSDNPSTHDFNFTNLFTDTCHLNLGAPITHPGFHLRIYVQANSLLIIEPDIFPNSIDCASCLYEIYYTGHPTIINHDSLDPRIILIDNN